MGKSGIYDVTVARHTDGGREVVAEFRGRSRVIGGTISTARLSLARAPANHR